MPLLTLVQRDACILCGCRLRGFMVGTFRINKHSLRSSGTLGAQPPCPECQTVNPPGTHYVPNKESAVVLADARARKGWTP